MLDSRLQPNHVLGIRVTSTEVPWRSEKLQILGFKVLGFRVKGFMFYVLGFLGLGIRVYGFRV